MMAIQLLITASYSSSTFYILDKELRYYLCSKTRSLCQLCLCHCAAQLQLSCVQAFLCKTQLELRITLTETYVEPAAIKSLSQSFLADTDESCSRLCIFQGNRLPVSCWAKSTEWHMTDCKKKYLDFKYFSRHIVINPVFQKRLFIFRELNPCI